MNPIRPNLLLAWFVVWGIFPPTTHADPMLWFSATDSPTAITNPTISVPGVGQTAPLFLFAQLDSDDRISGLGLSITNATTGIASGSLTSANWENPNFLTMDRWNTSSMTGLAYAFTPGQLTPSLNAVAVSAVWGLNGGVAAADPTRHATTSDATTSSLLVGEFTVTGLAVGSTQASMAVGSSTISGTGFTTLLFGAGDATTVDPSMVGATGSLADVTINVVPEPSGFALCGIVLASLAVVRFFVRLHRQ